MQQKKAVVKKNLKIKNEIKEKNSTRLFWWS